MSMMYQGAAGGGGLIHNLSPWNSVESKINKAKQIYSSRNLKKVGKTTLEAVIADQRREVGSVPSIVIQNNMSMDERKQSSGSKAVISSVFQSKR